MTECARCGERIHWLHSVWLHVDRLDRPHECEVLEGANGERGWLLHVPPELPDLRDSRAVEAWLS